METILNVRFDKSKLFFKKIICSKNDKWQLLIFNSIYNDKYYTEMKMYFQYGGIFSSLIKRTYNIIEWTRMIIISSLFATYTNATKINDFVEMQHLRKKSI